MHVEVPRLCKLNNLEVFLFFTEGNNLKALQK